MKRATRANRSKKNQKLPLVPTVAVVAVLLLPGAGAVWLSSTSSTLAAEADLVVYKSPSCQCCEAWVDHLRSHGLTVETAHVDDVVHAKSELGVPERMAACHTAKAGDYWIEGHVPADLVMKLLAERPEGIRGIAVPGMPVGSPGMEGANPQPYTVLSVDAAGDVETYASREGQSSR